MSVPDALDRCDEALSRNERPTASDQRTVLDFARAALAKEAAMPDNAGMTALAMRTATDAIDLLRAALAQVKAELDDLRRKWSRENDEICQALGKALDYPWFKDDPKNFPDATAEDGVCVGDHVAASIAMEAASAIAQVRAELAKYKHDEMIDGNPIGFARDLRALEAELAQVKAERETDAKDAARWRELMARFDDGDSAEIVADIIGNMLAEEIGPFIDGLIAERTAIATSTPKEPT